MLVLVYVISVLHSLALQTSRKDFQTTVLAMCCRARPCGLVSSSEGKLVACTRDVTVSRKLIWIYSYLSSIFTVFLMLYRVKGAILIGIFLVSIISWPRPTSVTLFPHTDAGDSAFDFFKQVVTFRPLKLIGNALDVSWFSL